MAILTDRPTITPSPGDFLHLVDVSDPSDDPSMTLPLYSSLSAFPGWNVRARNLTTSTKKLTILTSGGNTLENDPGFIGPGQEVLIIRSISQTNTFFAIFDKKDFEIEDVTASRTLDITDNGKILRIIAGVDVDITLPQLSSESLNQGFNVTVLRDSPVDVNILTEGTDTFSGETTLTVDFPISEIFLNEETDPRSWIGSGQPSSLPGPDFEPTDLVGLQIWLDGLDTQTTQNGGFDVTEGVETIDTWLDKSGNVNNATRSQEVQRGMRTDARINGFPCVDFSNEGHMEINFNLNPGTNPTITVYLVSLRVSDNGKATQSAWGNYNANAGDRVFSYDHNGKLGGVHSGSGVLATTGTVVSPGVLGTGFISTVVYNEGVGGGSTSSINGELGLAFTENRGDTGDVVMTINTNKPFSPSGNSPITLWGEFILYNRLLTIDENTQILNYLSSRWNIPLT